MNSSTRSSSFKDLKCIDIGIIKGIGWAESMYETLSDGFQKTFLNWVSIVLDLSQNEEDAKEWRTSFSLHFEDRCCELVSDIQDLHDKVILNIEKNLKKAQELCESLHIDFPVFGERKLGLYEEQLLLKFHLSKLEQMIEAEDKQVCKAPDKEVRIIPDIYIEQLEDDKTNRETSFYAVKDTLIRIIEDLGYVPSTPFEKQVIYEENYFPATYTNLQDLENFEHKLLKECDNVAEEIGQLRNQIEQSWEFLNVEFMEREEFREKYSGNSYRTLDALRNELKRCKELKEEKAKVAVDRLRKELVLVWNACMVSQSTRDEFTYFHSELYTEDLVELHELELDKWMLYAEQNKDLLELLNEHIRLWKRQIELQESANGPNRFNNRGGKLLKEAKERNAIKNSFPKIEARLQAIAAKYFAYHRKHFLANGMTVEQYINDLYEKETVKTKVSSPRVPQGKPTLLAPLKTTPTLTPRNVASSSKKKFAATDVKITKPVHRRILTDPRRRSKGLASKTYALDRSKRSCEGEKIKDKDYQDVINYTYDQFQEHISKRKDTRSTTIHEVRHEDDYSAYSPLAEALPLTPIPSSDKKIPAKVLSGSKSHSDSKKPSRSINNKCSAAYSKELTVPKSNKRLNY